MDDREPGTATDDPVRQALIALLDDEPDRPDRVWALVKDNFALILKLKKKHSYKKIAATLSKESKLDVKEETVRTYTGRILRTLREAETQIVRSTESTMRRQVPEKTPTGERLPTMGQSNVSFKPTVPNDKDF